MNFILTFILIVVVLQTQSTANNLHLPFSNDISHHHNHQIPSLPHHQSLPTIPTSNNNNNSFHHHHQLPPFPQQAYPTANNTTNHILGTSIDSDGHHHQHLHTPSNTTNLLESPAILDDPTNKMVSLSRSSSTTSTSTINHHQQHHRIHKSKFSPEDDSLLIHLKENEKLSWKQIAEHFEGRTAGALQVRYCTKLKLRDLVWSDDDVELLRRAVEEYEDQKWNIISAKLNGHYSPSVCRDKYKQFKKK